MSFYGTTFYNLIGWLFKKQTGIDGEGNPTYKSVEMGPTSQNREIIIGEGLDINNRVISAIPCELSGTINGTTLVLSINQGVTQTTTQQEEEE